MHEFEHVCDNRVLGAKARQFLLQYISSQCCKGIRITTSVNITNAKLPKWNSFQIPDVYEMVLLIKLRYSVSCVG